MSTRSPKTTKTAWLEYDTSSRRLAPVQGQDDVRNWLLKIDVTKVHLGTETRVFRPMTKRIVFGVFIVKSGGFTLNFLFKASFSNHVNAYKHRYMIGLTLLIILILFSVAGMFWGVFLSIRLSLSCKSLLASSEIQRSRFRVWEIQKTFERTLQRVPESAESQDHNLPRWPSTYSRQ